MDTLSFKMLQPSTSFHEAHRALSNFLAIGSDDDTLDIIQEMMFMKKSYSIKPTVALFTAPKDKVLTKVIEEDEEEEDDDEDENKA
ncbi:hypothetical protein THRCLA_20207 [Thraustotheca clavata]|uniref:Uncharacterized protein n=1 Tax=Thraustotheca clavata TaxID=74557 RepID=A0A1W0AAG9_9STRA|nr:hypothetical protein THRCLA_20207 [Thraustotheca clavata]